LYPQINVLLKYLFDIIDVSSEDRNEMQEETDETINRICYEREYNNYSTKFVFNNNLDDGNLLGILLIRYFRSY
jgi:hypothetical protein